VLALGVGWLVGASLLWQTDVPDTLVLPDVDVRVPQHDIDRAERYETFMRWSFLSSQIVAVFVLLLYAWRGARFTRESAAGRIGTGMLLGMLGLALVWLSQIPFQVAELWWQRRYGLWTTGYLEWFFENWIVLAAEFSFICLWLLITMALAAVFRRRWWLGATPVFVGLALLFVFIYPYLVTNETEPPADLQRAVERYSRQQGTDEIKLVVQEVSDFTDAPNAQAAGLGPSRRVFLWDTLIDGRFDDDEVRMVLAHEVAHHSREHLWKGIAWYALLSLPLLAAVARFTRRRGGLYEPHAVPLALLALFVGGIALQPLSSAVTRRFEAEADWIALDTTRDPAAARRLFEAFTLEALADPDPPAWAQELFSSHPSVEERIAMTEAWRRRNPQSAERVADDEPTPQR
jgi:Zn-dependent protease with chaperone function